MEQLRPKDLSKIYTTIESCTSFEHIASCYHWLLRLRDKLDESQYTELYQKINVRQDDLMSKYIYAYLQ